MYVCACECVRVYMCVRDRQTETKKDTYRERFSWIMTIVLIHVFSFIKQIIQNSLHGFSGLRVT